MACNNSRTLIVWGTVLGPLVVVFAIVAFATDHWVDIEVNRAKLNTVELAISDSNQHMGRVFHSRHRGIMRECFPHPDAIFLDNSQRVVDGNCFYIDMDEPDMTASDNFYHRMHLIRTELGCFIVGMVLVIITFILGTFLCCFKSYILAIVVAVFSFTGSILMLIAIVMFHTVDFLEANENGGIGELNFQNTWTKNLLVATDSEFGFSYALAWVAVILAGLDGILFIMAARAMRREPEEDRKPVIPKQRQANTNSKQMAAYDNHGGMMMVMPPMYGDGGPMMMPGYPPFMAPHQPQMMIGMPGYDQMAQNNVLYALPGPQVTELSHKGSSSHHGSHHA